MSGWITERADAYCDSVRDGTHDSPKPVERGHRLITSKHIANETLNFAGANFISDEDYEAINQRSRVDVGDLLFSMIGTVGRVYRVDDEPDYAIKNMGLFKISDELKSKYLFYYMQSPTAKQYIEGCLAGSTQKFMSLTNLRAFPIVYPNDHTTMAAIVEILDSLTWKHRINQRTNDYLADLCDALFSEFVATSQDDTWHEGTLEELLEVKYGKDHKKLADGPYPVYGSGGFMRSVEKPLSTGESVLIPRKGSLNNVMYVDEEFWTVDTMFYTVPRIPGAAKYAYQHVKVLDLASMNSGSAVPSMTTNILNALSLPIPSEEALASFDAKLQPMYDLIKANNHESTRLAELRDALLPKLMSGEIDVSGIDLTQLNNHLSV